VEVTEYDSMGLILFEMTQWGSIFFFLEITQSRLFRDESVGLLTAVPVTSRAHTGGKSDKAKQKFLMVYLLLLVGDEVLSK